MAETDLRAIAFPTLNEVQLASLERYPRTLLKRYRDGQKLFEPMWKRPSRREELRRMKGK
jgi:hypothetical protein